MARTVLKERVFAPVGRSLGTFLAMDLETFDMEYTESDEQKEDQSGGSDSRGKKSTVPEPKDDNPIKPEDSSSDSSDGSGASSSGSSSSGDKKDEPEKDKDIPDEWDIEGQDLDDEEPPEYDDSDTESSSGGYSDEDDTGSSQSSSDISSEDLGDDNDSGNDSTIDGNSSNRDLTDDNTESDEQKEDQSGGSDSGEGLDDIEDSDGNEAENSDSEEDSNGDYEDQNSGPSDNNDAKDSKSDSSGSSAGGISGEDSAGGEEDISYDDDWDSGESDGSDGWSQSDLEKAVDTIESNESETSKRRRESEEEIEKEREKKAEDNPLSTNSVDPDEAKAARDMLGQAIKDSRDAKKNMTEDMNGNIEDLENSVLGAMGAGSLTTMFNPNNAADWKMQLNKILDTALGFDIITNPNLVNKKIEDAPPGREDEIPDIKDIAVLLDCSGSMGAAEFKQVIQHMDTMFQVRKMDKVNFHIIGWGSYNVREVLSSYSKVKGRNFRREIMKYRGSGSTHLTPAFLVASQKIHKPDAILILTDAMLSDTLRSDGNSKIAAEYIRKYRKKIIWVLTAGSFSSQKSQIEGFDPTAVKMNRIIKFK